MRKKLKIFVIALLASAGLVFAEGDYYNQKYGGGGQSGGSSQTGGTQTGGGTQGGNTGGNQGSQSGTGSSGSESGTQGGDSAGSGESQSPGVGENAGDSKNDDGHYDNDNNYNQNVDSVINACENGGNLNYVSDKALQQTYYSDSATQAQKDQIKAELDRRGVDVGTKEEATKDAGNNQNGGNGGNGQGNQDTDKTQEEIDAEVAEALKKAQEAENAAAEAMRDLAQIQKQIEDMEKKLKEQDSAAKDDKFEQAKEAFFNGDLSLEDFIEERDAYADIRLEEQKLEELKAQEEAAFETVCEKFEEMSEAYKELAEVYEEYGITGDPVEIATGKYIASYDDFVAQDFLTKFTIIRKHTLNSSKESFGPNWTCPLDSRIIRTTGPNYNYYVNLITGMNETIQNALDVIDDYDQKYPDYQKIYLQYLRELFQRRKDYNETYLEYFSKLNGQANENEQLNQYAHYGRYINCATHEAVGKYLLYLDQNGNEYRCIYDNQGYWKPLGKINSTKFKIYDSNGFIVEYTDGKKITYSKEGILQKETDRNGNTISYVIGTGHRISQIKLKTGETLTVSRNSELYITSISGPVSGSASYSYSNGRLKTVTDNNGITVSYDYDADGYITGITKSDSTKVIIRYGLDSYTKEKVCTSVTNENGNTETFSYDYKNRKVQHVSFGGFKENYVLNEAGNTISYSDGRGSTSTITPGNLGLVQSITKDGIKADYSYNSNFQPVKIIFSDGGNQTVSYNKYGQISEIKDRDGFTNKYTYDSAGNVIAVYYCGVLLTSATYYSNGLVKTLSEAGCSYSYEYNAYGSIIKKICRDSAGKTTTEKWSYDKNNRVSSYTPAVGDRVSITYSSSSPLATQTVQYGNRKQEIKKFNNRGWIIEYTEKDLQNNDTYTLNYDYDGVGNLIRVYLNKKMYCEYSYNSAGFVIASIVWNLPVNSSEVAKQAIKTTYSYDSFGRVITESVEVITDKMDQNADKIQSLTGNKILLNRYSYSNVSNQTTVKSYSGEIVTGTYVYDVYGRLIRKTLQDGFTKYYTYSKTGKISSITDSNKNYVSVAYKNDGSTVVTSKNGLGDIFVYTYNSFGQLVSIKDGLNQLSSYTYDSKGNLVSETLPWKNTTNTYDSLNRLVKKEIRNSSGELQYQSSSVYDDSLNQVKNYRGDFLVSTYTLDCWNRIIRETTSNGTSTFTYDFFGKLIQKTDENGNTIQYEYSPYGTPVYKKDADDSVKIAQFLANGKVSNVKLNGISVMSVEYDALGRPIKTADDKNNVCQYDYDSNGLLSLIQNYDTGAIQLKSQLQEKRITVIDDNKQNRVYEVGDNGKILSETDALGHKTTFTYDKNGRISTKTFASGIVQTYTYDDKKNTILISTNNGEQIFVEQNALNYVTKLKTKDSEFWAKYDTAGHLINFADKRTDYAIDYSYDESGRCAEKKSALFDYQYSYNDAGFISEITDKNSQSWIKYTYDVCGRVINEKYSNGLEKNTVYNSLGEKSSVTVKNLIGEIVFEQKIHYNEANKIDYIITNDELYTYSYDDFGRLVKVSTPYTELQRQSSYNEAVDCGLGIQIENPDGSLISVQNENGKIIKQYSWYEEYEYTSTGSISSVTNPFGKILYDYDALNRITKKHGANTNNKGITYVWNEDDCLTAINGQATEVIINYNAQLRPKSIVERNFITGEANYFEYTYDGLGRRISETVNNLTTGLFYDGFNMEPVAVSIIQSNGELKMTETPVSADSYSQSNYRWIDSKDYTPYEDTRGLKQSLPTEYGLRTNQDLAPEKKLIITQPYSILYMNGKPVLRSYVDGSELSGKKLEFLISDFRGDLAGKFNSDGDVISFARMDLWGNEAIEEKEAFYSYSISKLNTQTLIFDCGYRDYMPAIKSFMTRDPQKVGNNWFAFCSCDPINYSDFQGFKKKSNTSSEDAKEKSGIAQIGKFNKEEYLATGESQGIKSLYDCADVSSCVDHLAREQTGKSSESEMQKDFDTHVDKGLYEDSKWDVQSNMYYDEGYEKDVTRTGGAEDRSKPDITEPGTVMVFKNNTGEGSWTGHTITILARDFDENGNVVGVAYIEGHTGGGKTETSYMRFDTTQALLDNLWSLFAWKGEFMGFYQLEATGTEQNCGK